MGRLVWHNAVPHDLDHNIQALVSTEHAFFELDMVQPIDGVCVGTVKVSSE